MQGDSKVRSTSADDQNFPKFSGIWNMDGELQKKSGGGVDGETKKGEKYEYQFLR